ncbi:GNAT family N-acetyltransferase [Botrimarina hoheduenensis]|uniref:Putative acetyltransferase n=1 Tax=Botrimarina hoheduenensis TaxID=2528000 RepID=A0A5C5VTB7_9BACT|nr:GNAT family N-acetyltransferase [Botrimarina hoheduenensis]TWT41560.1 putative acetyltransferase [Botrimarina hoheduenensis]
MFVSGRFSPAIAVLAVSADNDLPYDLPHELRARQRFVPCVCPRLIMLTIRVADLANTDDATSVVELTDAYSRDPLGDGKPLDPAVRERLIPALRAHPTTVVLLAFNDGQPIGIATCFVGFSTFAATPLLNVHDLAVLPGHRGLGVGRALLHAVDEEARSRGCCKVTLEVMPHNTPALTLYESHGFRPAMLHDGGDGGRIYAKPL